MGYIGKPAGAAFTETVKDSFNGDNSTVAFTMSQSVSLDTDIEVFVGNVQQEPGSGKAYTVSGTTLTFSEAPPTGTANIYVIHRNSLQGTILPPQNLGDRNYLIGGNLSLDKDSAVLNFGADSEITVTHVADTGLNIKHTATGDDKPVVLTLQTGETDIAQDDVLGTINFQAPDEGTGTDAILVAAGISAVSEGDFSSSSNATKLVFKTGSSEAASEKMSLSSAGLLTIADDLMIKDGGTIGVASANDAITIASTGIVTFKDDIIIKDAGTIGSASDVDAISIGSDGDVTLTQDLELQHDGAILSFGADDEIKLIHEADTGLLLKHANTADDKFPTLTFQTGDTDIAQDDVLGRILFQAPDEGAGTDAITSSARIQAISEGDFSASSNVTSLELRTAQSGVVGTAGQGSKLTLTSDFQLQLKSMSTADGSFPIFELQTGETAVETNDILGSISFKAPDESGGTDAITQAAFIIARAGADFTSSVNDTKLQFGTGLSGAASTRLTIDSDGDVLIEDGDLVIGTAGHGIDFSASSDGAGSVSVSNEVLSDYEEGTWTPSFPTLDDATVSTINAQDYTRVGRMVHVYLNFTMPSTSDTSAIQIAGLPFDGDNNKIQTFGTPFNNLNIDLVPYVQNSAIFIGKSDNFSDTTYANASGKYIRLSAWYSIL